MITIFVFRAKLKEFEKKQQKDITTNKGKKLFDYGLFFKYLKPNEGWKLTFLSTNFKLIFTNWTKYYLFKVFHTFI